MKDLEIRYGTEKDADLLSSLGAKTFWEAYKTESRLENKYLKDYMASSFSLKQIADELSDPRICYLIAETESEAAGYAKLVRESSRPEVTGNIALEISRIYLGKEFWGSGVGSSLLERCIEEAQFNRCDVIWLSVWQYNDRAIAFYEKHGFSNVGSHLFDLASSPQTDYVMEKTPCMISARLAGTLRGFPDRKI